VLVPRTARATHKCSPLSLSHGQFLASSSWTKLRSSFSSLRRYFFLSLALLLQALWISLPLSSFDAPQSQQLRARRALSRCDGGIFFLMQALPFAFLISRQNSVPALFSGPRTCSCSFRFVPSSFSATSFLLGTIFPVQARQALF